MAGLAAHGSASFHPFPEHRGTAEKRTAKLQAAGWYANDCIELALLLPATPTLPTAESLLQVPIATTDLFEKATTQGVLSLSVITKKKSRP